MKTGFRRLLPATIAAWGLFHLHAAFFPSVLNWGVHHAAFTAPPFLAFVPALMILLAVPAVQDVFLLRFRAICDGFATLPRSARIAAVAAAMGSAVGLFVFLPSSGILGDGLLLVNQLSLVRMPSEVRHVFPNEPLSGLLVWSVARSLFGGTGVEAAEHAYRAVSVASGVVFLAALFVASRRLSGDPAGRALAFLSMAAAAPTLLFFGYVENYSAGYAALALFSAAALLYLRGEAPVFLPAAAAGTMIPFYLGLLWFLPAALWLAVVEWRRAGRPLRAAGAVALVPAIALALLVTTGYTPGLFLEKLSAGGAHVVGLMPAGGKMPEYTLLSSHHLADLANFLLLISPAALVVVWSGVTRLVRDSPRDQAGVFLLLMTLCGAGMVSVFLPELGMPRDWDLLAPMAFGLLLFAPYLAFRAFPAEAGGHRAMAVIAVAGALHMVPWIALNHDPDAGIAQFRMILRETTWISNLHSGFEGLAMAAKRRGDYEGAAGIYKEFLERDSTHARILGNLADVYRVLGQEESELAYTERAVRNGSPVPALHFNLGTIYARRGRYAEAITAMEGGLRLEPARPDIVNAVGSFMLRSGGSCAEALTVFLEAIRLDRRYALAWLNAGDCAGAMGDSAGMRRYFGEVAKLDPALAARFGVPARLSPGGGRRP